MRCKPSSCSGCVLESHGNDFSRVEGTGSNGVLIVAEASGEMEQREQLPLRPYAPAGAVLERCLRRMGLDRKQFAITNVVRCRPRKNWLEGSPWEYSAIRQCRPNLDAAIVMYKPRCIIALGGVALRELTGEAGESRGITHLAGYVLPLQHNSWSAMATNAENTIAEQKARGIGNIPVIADFHPSYLRRGKASYQGVFSRIIQRALGIASGRDRSYAWGIDPDECYTWNVPGFAGGSATQSGLNTNAALNGAGHSAPPVQKLNYWTRPTTDQARSVLAFLKDNPNLPVAKDIETSESSSLDEDAREGFSDTEVRLFQLSYQPGTGIAIPYTGEFKAIVREMLHLRNPFYGHNWDNFDHKVLRACAAREGWVYAPPTRVFDTLDMFHHWQPDLPAHLQFASSFINFPFPWKHLAASNIEFYGICDVDADLQLGRYLESVLKKDGLWGSGDEYSLTTGYTGQEREVRPVLAAMEDRGVPIDDSARIQLGAEFEATQQELGVELAKRAPVECRRVHPKEGYKGQPLQVKAAIKEMYPNGEASQRYTPTDFAALFGQQRFQDSPTTAKDGTIEEGEWYTYQRRTFSIISATTAENTGEPISKEEKVERWCRVYDFNPNSSQQLIAYMKAKGHRVPKSKIEDEDGNQKDTTAAKELQRLAVKTDDDFYLKVIEYRGLTKLRGTYVDGFRPGADGRVHTTFTFQTAIAQLSARNPNTTNFPKLKPTPKLAKALRGMICADEGHVIAEVDFKSCHVITLGLLAGDENYTRLGRLDIHSAVAGHFLGHWDLNQIIKETDDELMQRFRWLKSDPERKRVRDDQAKHGILGIGNGLRARGLYERYMESFPSRVCPTCSGSGKVAGLRGQKNCGECKGSGKQSGLQIAEAVLATCEQLFPRVFEYQELQRKEAHETQRLRTPFGHLRRFYEVYRWDGRKGCWSHGDQAEEAVAYRLANTAHAHMREVMKELARLGLDAKYNLFNMIHDSLMLMPREDMLPEFVREVIPVMTAPSKVMPGLWLGVEASYGRRWNQMKDLEIPPEMLTPPTTMATATLNNTIPQEITA